MLIGLKITIALISIIIIASIYSIGKTCVFSSVKAQVLKNGKPLKNVKVIRQWEWNKLKEQSTTTDENGFFTFPAIFEFSIIRFLPIEIVIGQSLNIFDGKEEKRIWSSSKRNPEENSEYGGNNINIICELTEKEKLIEKYGISKIVTACKLNKDN